MKSNEKLLTQWAADAIDFHDGTTPMIMPRDGMSGIGTFLSEPGETVGNAYGRAAVEFIKNNAKASVDLRKYLHAFRPDLLPVTGIWLARFDTLKELEGFVQRYPWTESLYRHACAT